MSDGISAMFERMEEERTPMEKLELLLSVQKLHINMIQVHQTCLKENLDNIIEAVKSIQKR